MALTLIIGPANAGKTGAIIDRLRERTDDETATLLVPSRPEAERALVELASKGLLGVRVVTMDAYLDELWASYGDGRLIVTEDVRSALIARAIEESRVQAGNAFWARPGAARIVATLLTRAGEAGALDGRCRSRVRGDAFAEQCAAVVDAYASLLATHGLIERTDAHRAVTAATPRAALPAIIAVNRFETLTSNQERFVVWASSGRNEVLVSMTYDPAQPATHAVRPLVDRLSALEQTRIMTARGSSPATEELAALQGAFCSYGAQRVQPHGDVVLLEASDAASEAAMIAALVNEELVRGTPPAQVAVVYRRAYRYAGGLVRKLADTGIVWQVDIREPFGASGLGAALLALLAFVTRGYHRTDLVAFLRSGYIEIDPDAVDALDAQLRKQRTGEGRAVLSALGSVSGDACTLIEDACAVASNDASLDAWRGLIDGMLKARRGEAAAGDIDAMRDVAARARAASLLVELEALGLPMDARSVHDALERSMLTIVAGDPEGVCVTSAERARSRRFDVVVLASLVAGEFPFVPGDDVLRHEGVAAAFAPLRVDLEPRAGVSEERLLFYQLMTGARRRLMLSRHLHDDDGSDVAPSLFIEEVLDAYRATADAEDGSGQARAGRGEGWPEGVPVLTPDDLLETPGGSVALERHALRRGAARTDASDPRVWHAIARGSARRGYLRDDAREALASREVFSAGELEVYRSCPYRWFFERSLAPSTLDREIDAVEGGSIAHEILAQFYERWHAAGHSRVEQRTLDEALALHEEVARRVVASRGEPLSLAEVQRIRRAVRGSRMIIETDAAFLPGYEPIAHEYRFGFGEDGEPTVDMGGFSLRGAIDRVDSGPEGLVVIDYKSSTTPVKKEIEEGSALQIALYAKVAQSAFGREVVAGLYRSLKPGTKPRGFHRMGLQGASFVKTDACLTMHDVSQLIDTAVEHAREAVEGIRSASIEPNPRDPKTCKHCRARSVCGEGGE